ERGLSSFDRRHVVSSSFSYASPVGGKNGILANHKFLEKALKDWNLSSQITAQTGSPFTARVLGNVSDAGGTGSIGSGRANATGFSVRPGRRLLHHRRVLHSHRRFRKRRPKYDSRPGTVDDQLVARAHRQAGRA